MLKKNKRLTRFSRLAVGIVIVVASFVAWDAHTPHEIRWEKASLDGLDVMRAPELIIQHQNKDEIWATIGYSIYRSRKGENFKKVFANPAFFCGMKQSPSYEEGDCFA